MIVKVLRPVAIALAVLLAWELVGHIPVDGIRVFPPPTAILADYIAEWDLYLAHVGETLRTAAIGFVIGNTIAILAALVFARFPLVENIFHGVNVTLFAVPMIVVGPVLVLILDADMPQIVLAALIIYFPTMAATLVGLRDVDPRLGDLIEVYGGGESAKLRFIRLRSALPSLFAGLKVAASLSVLGAILGEFGSGERWGLGTFLLGSLGQANAPRLWGIGIAAAGLAMSGFGILAWINHRMFGNSVSVTMSARLPDSKGTRGLQLDRRLVLTTIAIALPFLLWGGILELTGLSPIIAPGPLESFHYLFLGPESAMAQSALFKALASTVPVAALGFAAGLAAAFVLAALTVLAPGLSRALMPVALLLQSTPLVAIAPILLLVFGRSLSAAVTMAVIVVFFPAFVLLSQGFALVPRAALEVVEVYGGSRLKRLLIVSIPYSTPYLFAAAKLVAPRALLGVMIAEWLLTGTGLGNLLDFSRAQLDYGLVWSGAAASVIVAVLAYQLISVAERFATR